MRLGLASAVMSSGSGGTAEQTFALQSMCWASGTGAGASPSVVCSHMVPIVGVGQVRQDRKSINGRVGLTFCLRICSAVLV